MTAEKKWQSILDNKWPHNTMREDRIFMAKFISILEEENGFECGAYIEKEKRGIVVTFPSGAQIARNQQDVDPFALPLLEYLGIGGETKFKFLPSNENIQRFLKQYWDELFPKPKETT